MRLKSQMPDLTGTEMILNNSSNLLDVNKVTLVYFWSMSCTQCKESFPKLKELVHQFSDKINVLSIHMPRSKEDQNVQAIKQQLDRFEISFPVYIDQQLRLTNLFENRFVPAYYVFDKDKKLRFYQAGSVSKRFLQQRIERLI